MPAPQQHLFHPTINRQCCRACHACLSAAVCLPGAIQMTKAGEYPVIDVTRCSGCMLCVVVCPYDAVQDSE